MLKVFFNFFYVFCFCFLFFVFCFCFCFALLCFAFGLFYFASFCFILFCFILFYFIFILFYFLLFYFIFFYFIYLFFLFLFFSFLFFYFIFQFLFCFNLCPLNYRNGKYHQSFSGKQDQKYCFFFYNFPYYFPLFERKGKRRTGKVHNYWREGLESGSQFRYTGLHSYNHKYIPTNMHTQILIPCLQVREVEKEIATDESRNAYGRTKRKAENLCFSYVEKEKEKEQEKEEEAGLRIAILRCSRFFLEDVFDSDLFKKPTAAPTTTPEHHQPQPKPTTSSPNTKANELFSGVRISLLDLLLTHLLSLSLLHYHNSPPSSLPFPPVSSSSSSFVLGPMIVSSPSPLFRGEREGERREMRENLLQKKKMVYQKMGWTGKLLSSSYPPSLSSSSSPSSPSPPSPSAAPSVRLYDSSFTWKTLGWAPYFDFLWILDTLEKGQEGESEQGVRKMILLGLY